MTDKLHRVGSAMIQAPGRRLLHMIPLPFVRNRASGAAEKSLNANLNLTSFIDFLIVVVVFLLMSFSAQNNLPPEKNITPPTAENVQDLLESPIVSVSGYQILVDGTAAGSTRDVEASGRTMRLDELHRILKAKRELYQQVNPGKAFPEAVLLQIDKRVSAVVVKSVFQTAAQAGFPQVSFMVGRLQSQAATVAGLPGP